MNKFFKKFLVGFISLGLIIITGSNVSFINDNKENESSTKVIRDEENKDSINKIHIMTASAPDFTTGEGTEDNPFLIENIDDFKKFNNHVITGGTYLIGSTETYYVDSYYKLTNDLTINSTTYSEFISIGTSGVNEKSYYFSGVFDGNNKKITLDTTIDEVSNGRTDFDYNNFGLFSYCTSAEIKNLNLDINIVKKVLKMPSSSKRFCRLGGLVGSVQGLTDDPCKFTNLNIKSSIDLIYDSTDSYDAHNSYYYVGGLAAVTSGPIIIDKVDLESSIDFLSEQSNEVRFGDLYVGGVFARCDTGSIISATNSNFKTTKLKVGGNNNLYFEKDFYVGGFIGLCFEASNGDFDLKVKNSEITIGNFDVSLTKNSWKIGIGLIFGQLGFYNQNTCFLLFYKVGINIMQEANITIYNNLDEIKCSLFCGCLRGFTINLINVGVKFKGITITNSFTDTKTLYYGNLFGFSETKNYINIRNSYIYQESGVVKSVGNFTNKSGLFGFQSMDGMYIKLYNSYFYINKTPSEALDMSNAIQTEKVYSLIVDSSYCNISSSDIPLDFADSNLADMNTKTTTYNSDTTTPSYYFTLSKKNGKYPTFAYKVTLKAEGFEDRVAYVSIEDHSYDETLLTYEGNDVEGIYYDSAYLEVMTTPYFNDVEEDSTTYVKLMVTPEPEPEPGEPTGPTIPIGTEFNIIYDTKDGTINDANYPTTYICGVGASLPTLVTKVNYEFAGWSYRNLNGVIITSISLRQYGDVYLTANYTLSPNAKKYSIEYVNEVGKINEDYKTSYLDEEVVLPTKVTSDYGTFAGWYDNPEFTGRRIYKISSTDTGNKTYYARYIFNRYAIHYEFDDGTNVLEYYYYGDEVTLLNNFTKTGYTFVGLSETKDDDKNLVTKINKGDYGDKTYYVVFKENKTTNYNWVIWVVLGVLVVAAGITVPLIISKHKKVAK